MTSIVQEEVGKKMTLLQLKNTLAKAAINLFPGDDAFCYTEGKILN